MPPPPGAVERLTARQYGAITRAQLLALGATPDWIYRQVHARRWQKVFPGTFVTHTGPLRWRSRASAAVLHAGEGACLSHYSAGYLWRLLREPGPHLHVSIPGQRRIEQPRGMVVHRTAVPLVRWGRLAVTPPAVTLVDLVHRRETTVDDVVSLVAAARELGVRYEDVRAVLAARRAVRRRALLADLLAPSSEGIESPLEYRYVHRVERAHGLPRAQLQHRQRVGDLSVRADVRYHRYRIRVELDGELGHPGGTTDADVWRDNTVLVHTGEVTLRFRWRHIAVAPCSVAGQVAAALTARGWGGTPRRCGPACALDVSVGAQAEVPYGYP